MGMMCRTILRIMCGAIGPAAARDGPPPAARQLSAAIGRTFRSFDSDGNGTLDLGELRAAFASMVPRRPQPAGRARLGSCFRLASLQFARGSALPLFLRAAARCCRARRRPSRRRVDSTARAAPCCASHGCSMRTANGGSAAAALVRSTETRMALSGDPAHLLLPQPPAVKCMIMGNAPRRQHCP